MSIQSEITRISGNVADALTAIAAKGVTVPQGANSDDLADLIGSIASDLTTKTITLNGSYSAQYDNADGYSAVTVNVANGASMTEVANTYGTELVITSAQGSAPSATRHTLYFEFEDETTETEYAYYDDSFISSAITATTPTTRSNKTVTSAQLDGVEWYSYTPSTGTWETVYDDNLPMLEDDPYSLVIISDLANVTIPVGSVWRITIDSVTAHTTTAVQIDGSVYIGNPKYEGKTDDGSAVPICLYNPGWGNGWYGATEVNASTSHTIKIERQVSA